MARWGMPGPPQYGGEPVTNIRNVNSPHWRGRLGKRNRSLVPATSFCECADIKPRQTPAWFALADDRPLFAFAGLWASGCGVRGRCQTARLRSSRRARKRILLSKVVSSGER